MTVTVDLYLLEMAAVLYVNGIFLSVILLGYEFEAALLWPFEVVRRWWRRK